MDAKGYQERIIFSLEIVSLFGSNITCTDIVLTRYSDETLIGESLDEAASVLAGYLSRQLGNTCS
jgi:hypothetical protein